MICNESYEIYVIYYGISIAKRTYYSKFIAAYSAIARSNFSCTASFSLSRCVYTSMIILVCIFGEYSSNVSVAFAGALIAMIPAVVVCFLAQKYIVTGMTAGAVKN